MRTYGLGPRQVSQTMGKSDRSQPSASGSRVPDMVGGASSEKWEALQEKRRVKRRGSEEEKPATRSPNLLNALPSAAHTAHAHSHAKHTHTTMAGEEGAFCHACKAAFLAPGEDGAGGGGTTNTPGGAASAPADASGGAAAGGAGAALLCEACGSDFVERMPWRTAERRALRAARGRRGPPAFVVAGGDGGGPGGLPPLLLHGIFGGMGGDGGGGGGGGGPGAAAMVAMLEEAVYGGLGGRGARVGGGRGGR